MNEFVSPALVMVITTVSIALLKIVAPFVGLIDEPAGRKTHASGTALVGGIGLMIGFVTVFASTFVGDGSYLVVLNLLVLLVLLGAIDDATPLNSSVRLIVQLGVGIGMFYLADIRFLSVGDIWFVGDLGLGPFALVFTLIAVVGGINAVNMSDGLDGLLAGILLSCFGFLWFFANEAGADQMRHILELALAGLVTFFLLNYRFPWNPAARVFMGDSGTYALGFLAVTLFLIATQGPEGFLPPIIALWLLAVPLVDIAGTIYRRARVGKWPLSPGREHLHYMLVDRGYSPKFVVNSLIGVNFLIGLTGCLLYKAGVPESPMFVCFMIICVVYFMIMARLSEPEIDHL